MTPQSPNEKAVAALQYGLDHFTKQIHHKNPEAVDVFTQAIDALTAAPEAPAVDVEYLKDDAKRWYLCRLARGASPSIENYVIYLHNRGLLAATTPPPVAIDLAALERAKMWLNTEPNAPKHFNKYGNEYSRNTILTLINNAIAAQKGGE